MCTLQYVSDHMLDAHIYMCPLVRTTVRRLGWKTLQSPTENDAWELLDLSEHRLAGKEIALKALLHHVSALKQQQRVLTQRYKKKWPADEDYVPGS